MSDYPSHQDFHQSRNDLADISGLYSAALDTELTDEQNKLVKEIYNKVLEAKIAVQSLLETYSNAPRRYGLIPPVRLIK